MQIPSVQRAWQQTARGSPKDVLKLVEDFPVPKPTGIQVLVKVHSVALNPVGYKLMGYIPWPIATFPATAEFDFSGVVVDANGQEGYKVGDEVLGKVPIGKHVMTGVGALAEYITIETTEIAPKPQSLSSPASAGLVTTGLTAYTAIIGSSLAQPGQRIFINGGSTGVGAMAIQMAKNAGAAVVSSCSGKNVERVKGYGADEVLDYTVAPIHEQLARGKPVSAVYDCVGTPSLYQHSKSFLTPGGRFVSISVDIPHHATLIQTIRIVSGLALAAAAPNWSSVWNPRIDAKLEIIGGAMGKEALREVVRMCEVGEVVVPVDMVCKGDEAGVMRAYERIMSGRATGKVIVTM